MFEGDEVETVFLSKTTLEFGYPKGFDGTNNLSSDSAAMKQASYAWIWHPWLTYYITVGSFAIFGITPFSARLPFVIAGLLSIIIF